MNDNLLESIREKKAIVEGHLRELDNIVGDRYIAEAREDRYPRVGPFYYYQGIIISPDKYQRRINPTTLMLESQNFTGSPLEHRDMWDDYMVIQYPELKTEYEDNHKALPRGRVDFTNKNNQLSFFVTLDKCITGREDEIRQMYNLSKHPVSFSYGTMNYKCKDCK